MKKVLSVLLAVVMLASFGCFGVSAASDIDLLKKNSVYSNNSDGCTVSQLSDGGYEAVVTKAWDATTDLGYGLAIEPKVESADMTGMYVHISLVSDVPFRISHLDRSDAGDKWITYTSEFFNSVYPKGASGGTIESLVNEKFFPAGTYECVAFLGGVYTWKTDNGESGWDVKNGNITGIYIEAMEAGTMKLNSLKLSDKAEFDGTPVADNDDSDVKTTTAKKTTTTTKKAGASDNKADGANTGDVSKAALFLMVAAVATTAVTLSVVSAKAKDR